MDEPIEGGVIEVALEFEDIFESGLGMFIEFAGGLEGELREVTGHGGRASGIWWGYSLIIRFWGFPAGVLWTILISQSSQFGGLDSSDIGGFDPRRVFGRFPRPVSGWLWCGQGFWLYPPFCQSCHRFLRLGLG